MTLRTTISLITYNSERFLDKSLPALNEQVEKSSLIITDNDSSDNTVAMIKEFAPQAKLIANRQNLGFCVPHNKIISWCNTPYILILNPDVLLEKDYCKKLADYLDEHPECAAVSGLLYRWDTNSEPNQSTIDSAGLKLEKNGQVHDINVAPEFIETNVFGVSGAAVMYRVDVLKKIALHQSNNKTMYFDEGYYLYKEDVDLAFRIQLSGHTSVCLASAVGYHQRGLSGTINLKQRLKMEIVRSNFLASKSFANHYKTLYKNITRRDLKTMFLPIATLFLFRLMTTLVIKPTVAFNVLGDLIKNLSLLKKQRHYIQGIADKQISLASWYNN